MGIGKRCIVGGIDVRSCAGSSGDLGGWGEGPGSLLGVVEDGWKFWTLAGGEQGTVETALIRDHEESVTGVGGGGMR